MKLRPAVFAALAALFLVAAPAAVFSAPVPAPSTINAVTVYTDRAVVTRAASLELSATGTTEVLFEKLPAALLDQSLQVSGHGAAQVAILDVTARAAYLDFTPNERVKAVEDELRAIARERRGLDDRSKLLETQRTSIGYTEGALFAPASKDTARPTVAEVTAALAFLNEQRAKITTELATLDDQRESLAAKTDAAQRRLNELRGAGGRASKTVAVRLDVAAAGQLELALSYTVPGASWTPSYDARVNSDDKSIALAYHGLVRQNTGEDWRDVALTLSTARPGLGGAVPKLEPWGIDVLVPRPPMKPQPVASFGKFDAAGSIPLGVSLSNSGMMSDSSAKSMDQAATTMSATVEAGTTSAVFKVTAPSSVPSDNSTQKVPIVTAGLAANFDYLTTPKLQATAFLASRVENASEFPLLAGPMNVFLDGTFVAASALRTVMPGEKFDLALGADEGIAVKHRRVQRFAEDTGLTGRGRRVTYEYLITVQNNKKIPAHVIVADQIPVSGNEKIVVKQLAPDAREMKPTAEGALKWTLDLKPGEKRELTVKFSVDHPNEVQVAGLEP
ncbi:MAG: mucoidy inhibitor MuiA family protein [Verrucomicrobia bacterium]|nr:mucoidy inhibitor MuiA family protein [Verrucomicrobiota bacterium]